MEVFTVDFTATEQNFEVQKISGHRSPPPLRRIGRKPPKRMKRETNSFITLEPPPLTYVGPVVDSLPFDGTCSSDDKVNPTTEFEGNIVEIDISRVKCEYDEEEDLEQMVDSSNDLTSLKHEDDDNLTLDMIANGEGQEVNTWMGNPVEDPLGSSSSSSSSECDDRKKAPAVQYYYPEKIISSRRRRRSLRRTAKARIKLDESDSGSSESDLEEDRATYLRTAPSYAPPEKHKYIITKKELSDSDDPNDPLYNDSTSSSSSDDEDDIPLAKRKLPEPQSKIITTKFTSCLLCPDPKIIVRKGDKVTIPQEAKIACTKCRQKFYCHYHFELHKIVHGYKFACADCGARFQEAVNVDIHFRYKHLPRELRSSCVMCGAQQYLEGSIEKHFEQCFENLKGRTDCLQSTLVVND